MDISEKNLKEPIGPKEIYTLEHDDLEPLSQIIQELNEHFGTDFNEEDKLCIREIEQRLADNSALERVCASIHPKMRVSRLIMLSMTCFRT
jgi:hypothetical protein